jgi:hypothetical protein
MAVAMTFDRRRVEIVAGWIEKYAHLFGYTQARDGVWVPKSDLATYENGTRKFRTEGN